MLALCVQSGARDVPRCQKGAKNKCKKLTSGSLPRTIVGSEFENPTVLNRNDASGERGIWAQNDIYSYWKVNFKKGTYNFKFKFKDSIINKGTLFTEINNRVYSKKTEKVVYSTRCLTSNSQRNWRGQAKPPH